MLTFEYTMELDFGDSLEEDLQKKKEEGQTGPHPMAQEHAFTLRCLPQENATQHVLESKILMEPQVPLSYGTDAFGTRYCFGLIHEMHDTFWISISGKAERFPDRYEEATLTSQEIYVRQTPVTEPGNALYGLHLKAVEMGQAGSQLIAADGSFSTSGIRPAARERAIFIRDLVYRSMTYVPGATAPRTTAEEAAASGKGVCQDYAHIMLSLCRMEGIPCRYTAGLLLGEGTSHAWVEICDNGVWIPMDPTNPDVGWDEQLIFSHGRDARDCEINRGVYIGPHAQVQRIAARLRQRTEQQ